MGARIEIIPAILVKSGKELIERVERVKGHVSSVHIDVMDGVFVPNRTVWPQEIGKLPTSVRYEFHWMVKEPEKWISEMKGDYLHIVHAEAVKDWGAVVEACRKSGGRLGIAVSPETPLARIEPFLGDVSRVLIMSVHPGYDGQRYMPEVEGKIAELRSKNPDLEIEVDGGINPSTVGRAVAAGADKLAAASAVYSSPDAAKAIEEIKNAAKAIRKD